MTTMVIVQKDGHAAIAGDLMSTQGSCIVPPSHKKGPGKIVALNDSYIGATGSSAHVRVLESLAQHYADAFDLTSVPAIFETFRRLHSVLVDEYHVMTTEDDNTQEYESNQLNLLIANPTGIYEVQSYREVIQYERFWATGTGYRYALGTMEAIYGDPDHTAAQIAERAVEVGCLFDDASGLPAELYTLDLDD